MAQVFKKAELNPIHYAIDDDSSYFLNLANSTNADARALLTGEALSDAVKISERSQADFILMLALLSQYEATEQRSIPHEMALTRLQLNKEQQEKLLKEQRSMLLVLLITDESIRELLRGEIAGTNGLTRSALLDRLPSYLHSYLDDLLNILIDIDEEALVAAQVRGLVDEDDT